MNSNKIVVVLGFVWAALAMGMAGCAEELLNSSVGLIVLEGCEGACGACADIDFEESVLEFGPALEGETLVATLRIENDNQPLPLEVERFELDDPSGRFSLGSIRILESDEPGAPSTPFSLADGRLRFMDTELAEVTLTYAADDEEATTAELTLISSSSERSVWTITLRAGPIASREGTATADAACSPSATQPSCALDFGTVSHTEIVFDAESGAPETLSTKTITVSNDGDAALLVTGRLTDDGRPETQPDEQVGDNGVFYLEAAICTQIAPGDSLDLPVDFRPREAGDFAGEVEIRGLSQRVLVELSARVIGPASCLDPPPGTGLVDIGASCPLTPAVVGEPNCVADFGEFSDAQIGYDPIAGLPTIVGSEAVVVTNTGDAELFLGAELTDDGVPEGPGEFVGEFGVFFAELVQCELVLPGDSFTIDVDFRPFQSGTFAGELRVQGFPETVRIALQAKVTGPALCISTEDDIPDDGRLTFGVAPLFLTSSGETSESRRIYLSNCGYDADLQISNVAPTAVWNAGFVSASIGPWTPTTLGVGQIAELPFTFTPPPLSLLGAVEGNLAITDNTARGSALVRLRANIGPPKECVLAVSPQSVDFGWVATNEAAQPGLDTLSRIETIVLGNVGEDDCTGIQLATLVFAPGSENMFSVDSNPNPAPFDLAPGENSQPIEILFMRQAAEQASLHFAKLPLRANETTRPAAGTCPADHVCVDLEAKAGGNPNCELEATPVNPAGLFCPNPTVAFGNVNVGQTRTIDVKLRNIGSDTCTVTGVAKGGTGSIFSFTPIALPSPIAPNAFTTVPVNFTPIPPDPNNPFEEIDFGCGGIFGIGGETIIVNYYSGTATTANQVMTLSLSGKGTRPDIDVIPGEVEFGEVTVGCCSAPVRIAIYNSGDGTLDIATLDILASSDPGFQVVTPPSTMQLPPGSSTEFEVRWCASDTGVHSGVLEIISSDDNEEYFTVSLSGTGTLDSQGLDDFAQPLRAMVDVLWVVDDSGSMSDEQQSLATNFDSFITNAVSLDTDYHIGVVNTDVESADAGKLYACNGPLWITDTQPPTQQQSQFACNVTTVDWPRPHSDSKEAAMQAARLALDYPNLDGFNAGFYREIAKLYIILVTDEVDQSDGTAQQYFDYFRNLKGVGNPDLLNISAITGPPPDGCATAEGNQPGYDITQLANGQFRSICTSDWSDLVATLGLDVFTARQQFPLSRPGTGGTLAVEVCDAGGVNCHYVAPDPVNGWTFDATLNSVTFHGTSIPGPGQEIHISYLAVCFQ